MNIRITLKNIASYKEKVTLETDKKINLIYGLNGTGKTILSNYLYGKSKKEELENWIDFQDCEDSLDRDTKILVYNEKFIEDIFYEKIPGIFTLSSANKKAEKNIKEAKNELKTEKQEKERLNNENKELEEAFNQKKEHIQKTVWKIKEKYTGGDRPLNYCLEGLKGDKKKLFDYLYRIPNLDKKSEQTIDGLESILKSIEEGKRVQSILKLDINNETENIPSITKDNSNKTNNIHDEIENNPIFQEIIISSQDNSVAQLIKKLQNPDWVRKGLRYLPQNIEKKVECPFCQEKTITVEIVNKIKRYFDTSYQEKLNKISELQEQYDGFILKVDSFETKNQENIFIKKQKDRFKNLILLLKTILKNNLSQIQSKGQNLSKGISLESSENLIQNLNQFIAIINQKIETHNKNIENKQKTKQQIKTKFWQIMRFEYNQTVELYEKENKTFKQKKKNLEDQIKINQKKISEQEHIIQENQKHTVNLETAISNINQNLEDMGITDFKIKKQPDDKSYFLTRNSSDNSNFKSLSEGEKTVISFLYFLELCQGKVNKEEMSDQKVIVIDDPISSLSHIYVFNIAQFIKKKFFNDQKNHYQKIFILTHNLYFFHELVGYTIGKEKRKKQTSLFRITKNPSSQIIEMNEKEIKNDYESYWEILKDCQSNNKHHPILPNVMRNILEYFFGFIDKSNFSDALDTIDNKEYHAFIRYMNRESHFDRENIDDAAELSHSQFFNAFKEVFEKSGYKRHYDKMMEI